MNIIAIVNAIFKYYSFILVIYALLSWFPNGQMSNFGKFINRIVEPYISIFDRMIPPLGGISFNVMIAWFALDLIRRGLITVLSLLIR